MENFHNFDFKDKYEKSKHPKPEHDYDLKDIIDFLYDQKTLMNKKQMEINDIIFKINQYIQDYVDFETVESDKYIIEFSVTPKDTDPTSKSGTGTDADPYVYPLFKFNNGKTIYLTIHKNFVIIHNILDLLGVLIFNYKYFNVQPILNLLLSFNYYLNNNVQKTTGASTTVVETINNSRYSVYSSSLSLINEKLKNIKTLMKSLYNCVKYMNDFIDIDKMKMFHLEFAENSRLIQKSLKESTEELKKIQEIQNNL